MENKEQKINGVEDIPKLRTFQSDIAESLQEQHGSVVRVALKEQERKQEEGEANVKAFKNNTIFIIVGLLLFTLGASIFGYYFWQKYKKEEIVLPQGKSFINGDHTTEINNPDNSLLQTQIEEAITVSNIPVGQVEQFLLTRTDEKKVKTQIPVDDIFSAYSIESPEGFTHSLNRDTYLFGIYQITEPSRFLLLRTNIFSNTFSETLDWENTIASDFAVFLNTKIEFENKVVFKDKIIKNEDVRVGYVDDKEVFAYTFFGPRKEFLLITNNTDALQSLITRFSTKLLEQ